MRLVEQIQEVISLLEAAKGDLQEWVDFVNEENLDGVYTDYTEDLISQIDSVLHEVGY